MLATVSPTGLPLLGSPRPQQRAWSRPQVARASAAAPPAQLGSSSVAAPAVSSTRLTLTLPQVLQHLEQLELSAAAAPSAGPATLRHHFSWVEHSTSAAAALMEGVLSDEEDSPNAAGQDRQAVLEELAMKPPHLLTPRQQAALILQAWAAAEHAKPEGLDATSQLMLPGLADVAVVSRVGWQRHNFKKVNQDSFLALPLAESSTACRDCPTAAACCSSALAIGVFDGHGRAGAAASAHLRNALASGLMMHNQLAQLQPACRPGGSSGGAEEAGEAAPAPGEEAAQLLERCFAAAAATMPSSGHDFSLSGSTAVMCLVQPGSVTAAWAGDSRAVLGLRKGNRYIACALTHDHKPSSPFEKARIESSGGWVMQTMLDEAGKPVGPHRVYLRDSNIPGLAVSRCFGDFVASSAGVISTPDVMTMVLPTRHNSSSTAGKAAGGRGRQQQQQGKGPSAGNQRNSRSSSRAGRHATSARHGDTVSSAATATMARPSSGHTAGRQGNKASQHPQHRRRQQQREQREPRGFGRLSGSKGQHVLIVASDGLWEFVSNAEAVRIASRCTSAQAAADALVLEAQAQWAVKFGGAHCDDITVAVAFLPAK